MSAQEKYVYFSPSISINRYSNTTHDIIFLNAPLSIMYPNNNGMVYKLNKSALEIITLFDGTRTYNQVVKFLSNKYIENTGEIASKIETCLSLLEKCGY